MTNLTTQVSRGKKLANHYTPNDKTRRVLTAVIAATILVAATAAVGRMVTGG